MINRLLAILVAALPLVSNAQLAVGEWELFNAYDGVSTYGNNMYQSPFTGYTMVETPDYVYYVSQSGLFSYDKDTQETYAYSAINKLSDSIVKGLWYNDSEKYLLIAYDSGNIDLLYDNGKIVNLPDIKDATLTTAKTINDVAFFDNKIYVATAFGLVVFNDKEHYVIDSGIYKFPLLTVAVIDGNIVVYSNDAACPKQYYLSYIPVDSRVNSFNNFKTLPWSDGWVGNSNSLRLLSGSKAIIRSSKSKNNYQLACLDFDFSRNAVTMTWLYEKPVDYPARLKDGRFYVKGDKEIVYINTDGTVETVALQTPFTDQAIAMLDGPASLWTASGKGIAQFDITTSPATVKKDYSQLNLLNLREANKLTISPSNRLYLNQMTKSNILGNGTWWLQRTSILDGGTFTDVTATDVTNLNKQGPAGSMGEKIIRDVCDVVEDPDDPDTYYAATVWEGVFKLTKNADGNYVESAHYYSNNSPIAKSIENMVLVSSIQIDRFGNLWIVTGRNRLVPDANQYPIYVLPAAARKKDVVTTSDWIRIPVSNLGSGFDARILVCQKSNMIFVLDGSSSTKILAYDTKGTPGFDDDTYYVWEKWVDQDGKEFTQGRATSIIEDLNGRVWIGAANGIIEITNPANATNPNMVFNRLKVPRRDGSGFADYLLDTQQVLSLAVDGTNRKWAGTQSSGLFYISADGDEIIESHDIDNSVLTDNCIYALACNPSGSDVYVATPDGVFRYNSKVAPGADDYSNVYAFPNPVRPDYTGWITIKGLIDGSRVKIADASGSVFLDTVSEGGMVTWDGCNRNGERVRTGVYYVYASKSGDGVNTQGAVTKILVVN